MPSINMIAARRAEKHRLEQQTRNLVYGITAEAGVCLLAVSFMALQLVSAQDHVSDLNARISKLKPQVQEIQQLQQATYKLQPKVTKLNEARASTLYWYSALENVSASMAPHTWLTMLTTQGDPTAPPAAPGAPAAPASSATSVASISMQGTAVDQASVGQTMLQMNTYPHFSQVNLTFVQQAQDMQSKSKLFSFQMVALLKSTAPLPTTKKNGGSDVQGS